MHHKLMSEKWNTWVLQGKIQNGPIYSKVENLKIKKVVGGNTEKRIIDLE